MVTLKSARKPGVETILERSGQYVRLCLKMVLKDATSGAGIPMVLPTQQHLEVWLDHLK
jgi:hypothetical protein